MGMNVVQVCAGRFHHFDLAKQLDRAGVLERFFTGYPRFKMKGENLPLARVTSFPWLMTPRMAAGRWGLLPGGFQQRLNRWAQDTLDAYVAANLPECDVLFALSGAGLRCGRLAQARGGKFVCDRGSSHIRYQDALLREEFARWGEAFEGVDRSILEKEEAEYAAADVVTVPSEFVRQSFIEMGVPAAKVRKVPYGVDLRRFENVGAPDDGRFDVLFVGQVGFRKGVPDLLDAFERFRHPHKRLRIVGSIRPEMLRYLRRRPLPEGVDLLGHVPQPRLKGIMSRSHVMVLPSIEEGLALVQAQAMACGCPVVATRNAGAEDLFTHGGEGLIVSPRDPGAIADCLQRLADDPERRASMSRAALERVKALGGWDDYGRRMVAVLRELVGNGELHDEVA